MTASRVLTMTRLPQARWSPIDFDYLGYAELRWGEYRRRKVEFLAAAEAVGR